MTTTDTTTKDRAADAYAEIAANRAGILSSVRPDGPRDMRSLLLRGERRPISRVSRTERNKVSRNGMFTYLGDSPLRSHEWWSTPDGESVMLSTKRIEAILDGHDDGGVPAGILAEFGITHGMDTGADEGQEDEHGIRPTEAETDARSEALAQMLPDLHNDQIIEVKMTTDRPERVDQNSTWPDGTKRVRIEADEPDPTPARLPLDQAAPVSGLADGVNRVVGFEEALRDTSLGHKAIAVMFPFTSETSVRRWRKANGVEIS